MEGKHMCFVLFITQSTSAITLYIRDHIYIEGTRPYRPELGTTLK
jgi:hypothetical protein